MAYPEVFILGSQGIKVQELIEKVRKLVLRYLPVEFIGVRLAYFLSVNTQNVEKRLPHTRVLDYCELRKNVQDFLKHFVLL